MFVDKHRRSGYPLSVELSPHGLAPARIGYRQMQVVRTEIVPQRARGYMSERISEVVSHHLRFSGSAGGEIHQHRVAVVVLRFGSLPLPCRGYAVGKTVESLRHLRPHAYQSVDRRRVGHGGLHMREHIAVAHTHYRLYRGGVAAIHYVAGRQQMSGRNRDGADLVESYDRQPELHTPAEYEHHHVAAPYAETAEKRSGAVGQILYLGKRVRPFMPLVVGPEQSALVGLLGGPCVDHIVSEIEVVGYVDTEIIDKILLRREAATFCETFYHDDVRFCVRILLREISLACLRWPPRGDPVRR